MDIMTPELLDLARERGSAFVAVATPPEVIEHSWDSTDARWEEILEWVEKFGKVQTYILFVGVVTEGVTVDNQTYEMREHLNMTVIHPAGYECWRIPVGPDVEDDVVISLGTLPYEELDFDLKALQAILPW
jgi:hypothetical protein